MAESVIQKNEKKDIRLDELIKKLNDECRLFCNVERKADLVIYTE